MSENSNTQEMTREVTITFKIAATNPFDLRKKKENLEKFARLPMDDQERIEQIISSSKATESFKRQMENAKTNVCIK